MQHGAPGALMSAMPFFLIFFQRRLPREETVNNKYIYSKQCRDQALVTNSAPVVSSCQAKWNNKEIIDKHTVHERFCDGSSMLSL